MGNGQGDEETTIKTFWQLIYKLVCKFPMFSAIVTIVLIFVGAFGTAAYYMLREGDIKKLMDAGSKEDHNLLPSRTNYRGFYVDVITTGQGTNFYLASEDMTLDQRSGTANAYSQGEVREGGKYIVGIKTVHQEWHSTGSRNEDYLSLSYKTVKEGADIPNKPAVGTYLLKSDGHSQYTGYISIRDRESGNVYECPYFLTDEIRTTKEEAQNYPMFQRLECTPITFP